MSDRKMKELLSWADAALIGAWKMLADAEAMYDRGNFIVGDQLQRDGQERIDLVLERVKNG